MKIIKNIKNFILPLGFALATLCLFFSWVATAEEDIDSILAEMEESVESQAETEPEVLHEPNETKSALEETSEFLEETAATGEVIEEALSDAIKREEVKVSEFEANEAKREILRRHYDLTSRGMINLEMTVRSDVLTTALDSLKTKEFKGKFVDFDYTVSRTEEEGFEINELIVPESGNAELDEQLGQLITKVTSLIKNSYEITSLVFEGLSEKIEGGGIEVLQAADKSYTVFINRTALNEEARYYFDTDYKLTRAERLSRGSVFSETYYEFEARGETYFLSSVRVVPPGDGAEVKVALKYGEFKGYRMPGWFQTFIHSEGHEALVPQSVFTLTDVKMLASEERSG